MNEDGTYCEAWAPEVYDDGRETAQSAPVREDAPRRYVRRARQKRVIIRSHRARRPDRQWHAPMRAQAPPQR